MISLTLLASIAFANSCGHNNEYCGNNSISEPIRSCSENFFYDDSQECCVSEVSYPALLRCANGGIPGPDGTCACESHPLSTCPDGFFYDGHMNSCVAIDRVPMIPSCAHRPELQGRLAEDAGHCSYLTEIEPRPQCPVGTKLKNGVCVSYNMLPEDALSYVCPDGWDFDPSCNECVFIETVDCKKQKNRSCKASKIKDCAVESFVPCDDCVIEDHTRRLCDGKHCKEHVKPDHVCQVNSCKMGVKEKEPKAKSFVQQVVCERVTTLPAKPTCSVGDFVKSKKGCCAETSFAPNMVCPPGCVVDAEPNSFGPSSACLKEMTYLTDFVCPAPYTVSCSKHDKVKHHKKEKKTAHPSSCECVLQNTAAVIPTCSDGSRYNPDTNMCVQIMPAVPYCAESDAVLVNGVCSRVIHEPVRLEYTVTYVTEKPCEFDQCIKEKVPIKKRKVVHKEVKYHNGKTSTKCAEVECVNINGEVYPPEMY